MFSANKNAKIVDYILLQQQNLNNVYRKIHNTSFKSSESDLFLKETASTNLIFYV